MSPDVPYLGRSMPLRRTVRNRPDAYFVVGERFLSGRTNADHVLRLA